LTWRKGSCSVLASQQLIQSVPHDCQLVHFFESTRILPTASSLTLCWDGATDIFARDQHHTTRSQRVLLEAKWIVPETTTNSGAKKLCTLMGLRGRVLYSRARFVAFFFFFFCCFFFLLLSYMYACIRTTW
jgi:hypothetical protein